MKKKILIFAVLISFICTMYFVVYNYRYSVPEPMLDIQYKKEIVKDSHNIFYRVENLRNLVGEEELTNFISVNDDNPQIYTPTLENRKNGVFQANLHMHTINSDGLSNVLNYLNCAQNYADKYLKNDEYVYLAITDHNTVLGAKELIKVLQKYSKKYPKVRVIAGIEVNSKLYSTKTTPQPIEIHTLVWCINPYDKYLNKVFYKKDLNDKWNIPKQEWDFELLVKIMSNYGIPGIAHPARYSDHLGEFKYNHIDELFEKYSFLSKKVLFTEGYYQSYSDKYSVENEYIDYVNYIEQSAKKRGIIRTGSTDSHGFSIFAMF